ncbi:MAG: DUF6455 family protein [Cohaesibacteraceae bacterium]
MANLFKKIDEHAKLMERMATATAADLSEAALAGDMDAQTYRGAVKACTRCQSVGACRAWLDQHNGTKAADVPDFCANQKLLSRLASIKH